MSQNGGEPLTNGISEAIIVRIKEAAKLKQKFKVVVFVPLLPGFEGDVETASVLKVQLHWQYQTICRNENSIYEVLGKDPNIDNPEDYISFYSLRTHAKINGNPETEMIYIHSKLMIVDDRVALMGSANINDRSLLGKRDSEICMVVEDTSRMPTQMNNREYRAATFAHTLRSTLYQEHFGLTAEEVEDPLSPILLEQMTQISHSNTEIYREVFRCIPDDNVKSFNDVMKFQQLRAPDRYDYLTPKIKGHAVELPKQFLSKENLKLKVTAVENFFPDVIFT